MLIFSSSIFCSTTCILYCDRWISFDWLEWSLTESQLILSERNEQTIGNLSLAWVVNVQLNEVLVPFRGHVSVSVRLPSNWKLKSSKRASAEGEDVALTDL